MISRYVFIIIVMRMFLVTFENKNALSFDDSSFCSSFPIMIRVFGVFPALYYMVLK